MIEESEIESELSTVASDEKEMETKVELLLVRDYEKEI